MDFMEKTEWDGLDPKQQEAIMKEVERIQKEEEKLLSDESGLKQLTMAELTNVIQDTVAKAIEPMTRVDRKHFMFPGIGEALKDVNTPQAKFAKTSAFLKAMVSGDVTTARTMSNEVAKKANLNEGTGAQGAFLVPEEFKAEILRLAPLYGVIRQNVRVVPMLYDVQNWPAAGATGQTAQWVNEGSQIKSTDPNFRQVILTIKKLAAIPKVTSELLADANVDVISYLADLIAEAFAAEEDNQGFNGTGSPFVGILQATGVPTTPHAGGTAALSLSYSDLATAIGNVYSNVASSSKFYFHRTMNAHLRSLITTTGAPILDPTGGSLLGFPLTMAEKLPAKTAAVGATTPYAIYGDLRRAMLMGERGSITMKISDQATVGDDNLFENDMSALRMIERVTLGVALPSSVTRITTAA